MSLPGDNRNPQAQVYPFAKEVLHGQDFNFSCLVPGDGMSMQWLKNGIAVPSDQTQRQPNRIVKGHTFNENLLMLRKVSRVDDGNYTCVVTTSQQQGYSNKVTARLSVKGTYTVRANLANK